MTNLAHSYLQDWHSKLWNIIFKRHFNQINTVVFTNYNTAQTNCCSPSITPHKQIAPVRQIWFCHNMDIFSALLAFCARNHWLWLYSLQKGLVYRVLMIFVVSLDRLLRKQSSDWCNKTSYTHMTSSLGYFIWNFSRYVGAKDKPCINNMLLTSAYNVHYTDVIMGVIASQITSLTIVYSTVYSDADQRKYQSSASQAFVWGIHQIND